MSAFERWGNLMDWLMNDGDEDLLERSVYFVEVRYPKARRFAGATEWT